MEKLIFDWRGHIEPPRLVDLSMAELEENFVSNLTESTTRQPIFDAFKKYNADLIEMVGTPLFQWIDGSFVTKKLNPNDIDFVTFWDYKIYEPNRDLLETRFVKDKSKITAFHASYQNLDAFAVPVYPESHKRFNSYKFDYGYWFELFYKTRENRIGKAFKKGFIQLNYQYK